MKRAFYFYAVVLLFVISFIAPAHAQLDDGTLAPDWTMTDIEGIEHNLYTYLDQDMSVILDFSAVWCGPCWDYHTAGILEELYTLYGPETGDGSLMIFYIEADIGTLAELNGGNGSLGDWVTGIDYPMFLSNSGSSNQMVNSYDIGYFPTIYTVCSNGIISETSQITADEHIAFIDESCELATEAEYGIIHSYLGDSKFCLSLDEISFRFINYGLNPIASADLDFYVNGILTETINWSGNLDPYDNEEISLEPIYSNTDVILELEISSINGNPFESSINDTYRESLKAAPILETANIQVEGRTGNRGDEMYWAILDDSGNIVADGGNPNVGLNNVSTGMYPAPYDPNMYGNDEDFSVPVTLTDQTCYSVIITDYYGNGMYSDNGIPYFSIVDPVNSTELIYILGDSYIGSTRAFLNSNEFSEPAPLASFTYTTASELEIILDNTSTVVSEWIWDFGDGTTSLLHQPGSHIYDSAGTYEICLTVVNSTGSSMSCQTVSVYPTGIEHHNNMITDLIVYPNPATDAAMVSLSVLKAGRITVELTNIAGQVIFSETSMYNSGNESISINTDNFTSGTYFVNVKTKDGVTTEKLVITK